MTTPGVYYTNCKDGRPRHRLEPWEIERVCQLYKENNSMETVGRLCGISRTLTMRILIESGVAIRKKGRTEVSYIDTWIDRQLEVQGPTIMERRELGARLQDLSKIYNVSIGHISRHVARLRDMRERNQAA